MDCTDGPVHMEIKRYHPSTDTFRIGGPLFKGDIDWDLLVRLTMKLATGEDQPAAAHSTDKRGISIQSMFQRASGSVLIFLPGVPEITRYLQYLRQEWDKLDHKLGNGKPARLITMPLHGGLSAADQKQVFIPAKSGELKIVAATNVAEASITIPDVSVVIDTCKVKEMYFVPDKQMNALITKFASHDSLRQRRGRAGRVSTGRCFRLVTEGTYDKFSPNGTPEILRVSVDDLILQIKAMQEVRAKQGGERESCMQVLSRCPDPPTSTAVLTSESILTKIQALDGDGGITPLGSHLAALPCAPKIGRLLVYGALLGCVYPTAIVAALLSCQSPFRNTSDKDEREKADAAKASFMAQSGYKSDQMAVIAAMQAWSNCKGNVERRRFAEQNFLNNNRMQDIEKLARELLSDLASLGLLVGNTAQALSGTGVDNKNSDKPKLVAAALCAGMYPNISRILRPPKRFEEVMGGAFEKEVDGKEIKFYIPDTAVDVPNSEEEEGDDDWSAAENDEKEQDRVKAHRHREPGRRPKTHLL